MFSTDYEALNSSVVTDLPSGSATYALWRSGSTVALLIRSLLSQFTMFGVVFMFYVMTAAVDYDQLHSRLNHPLCPPTTVLRATTSNDATLFETDCWGDRPIDLERKPSGGTVFVVVLVALSMLWEATMSFVARIRLAEVERWWADRNLPNIHDMEWAHVCDVMNSHGTPEDVEAFETSVTRRADMFVHLYSSVLDLLEEVPQTWHAAIDASLLLHRKLMWPPSMCFRVVALASFVAIPYLLVSVLCAKVFQNADVFRGGGSTVGPLLIRRGWTRKAMWLMREEGELTHVFEARARAAAIEAQALLGAMPMPQPVRAMGTTVLTLCGAFTCAVLLAALLVDEQLLTTNLAPGRTVAFFLALVGGAMTIAAPAAAKSVPVNISDKLNNIKDLAPKLMSRAATNEERCVLVSKSMEYWVVGFVRELFWVMVLPLGMLFIPADDVVRSG